MSKFPALPGRAKTHWPVPINSVTKADGDILMRTLFVSDLDGTLMRSDKTISDYSAGVINRLIEQGVLFTYATARSIQSAMEITGALKLSLPAVTRNGTVLADNSSGRMIKKAVFSTEEVGLIKEWLTELPRCGFVSCYVGDEMIKVYHGGSLSAGMEEYVLEHKDDPRMKRVESTGEMFSGEAGYITLIDEKEKLQDAYERMKEYPGWECVFGKDAYSDLFWLEICPECCTKATALLKLKEKAGADRLVVFGDSVNDIPMFRIADEAYAVENADVTLKQIATAVIGSNDDDAVARFLEQAALWTDIEMHKKNIEIR